MCHKGHDCKLKRTSPTAYCDCWEKCKCKSLVAGNQGARFDVLVKLIQDTDLVSVPNARGENILLFLVQTVARQMVEQRQHRPIRGRKSSRKSNAASAQDLNMPEHDLEPPRFSRRALDQLLNDWKATKAMLTSGQARTGPSPTYGDEAFLASQSGTALLDKFTHCLLVKCSAEMLDSLLTTLIRQLQVAGSDPSTKAVVRRFVRSVARVFVVFNVEMAPGGGKKKAQSATQPLTRCKKVFQVRQRCFFYCC